MTFAGIVHRIAYRIWIVLLAVRVALLIALVGILVLDMLISRAHAQPATAGASGARTQSDVQFLLGMASVETATRVRENCATGQAPADIAVMRQAGVPDLPDMVDGCIAALTRLGRDGNLGFVRDASNPAVTPALAFDSGFVGAYLRTQPMPSTLPSMVAVKAIAARCLGQAEPDTRLCSSAGYVYGTRIAHGEAVPTS
jgi:hypothetical protein